MYKIAMLLVLAFGFLVPSCRPESKALVRGSGNMTTDTRPLASFHGVELGLPGDMEITLGNTESITIEAEENIMPLIETEVRGGILNVGLVPGANIQPTKPIKYKLTSKSFDQLTTDSVGSIKAPTISAENFKAVINSSGNIELGGLNSKSVNVEIKSIGNVKIGEGEVTNQTVTISSSGSYLSPDLKCATATVTIDSSGDAILWVTDKIDVVINSSGSVRYYGDPKVKSEVNSSGSVQPLGQK